MNDVRASAGIIAYSTASIGPGGNVTVGVMVTALTDGAADAALILSPDAARSFAAKLIDAAAAADAGQPEHVIAEKGAGLT